MALLLHRKGITKVRPLAGGIDAWRDNDFPLEVLDFVGQQATLPE